MTPNITEEQRKQIINWAQANAGTEKETFNEERYCGLIDGATHYCQQKDEEIARLRIKIQEIDNMAQGNVPVSFWKIHLVCEDALKPIIP